LVVYILEYAAKISTMLSDIEEIVVKELGGLCTSCVHFDECVYRKTSDKVVIQCEVFENSEGSPVERIDRTLVRGLCLNCSKNRFCHLPREASGVWHCEEYE
jgi:hypothetical protein